jgi:hypothetical protein
LSAEAFPVDEALLAEAATRLRGHPRLRFVMGGAGTGKSSVCRQLHATMGAPVIDMDARMYGTWGDRWDPVRHPANSAWLGTADPLAWQLDLAPEAFLQFHAAATAEALDLLADELGEFGQIGQVGATDDGGAVLVDGDFGCLAVVARAVPPGSIVCLALPPGGSEAVWTSDPGRLGFLEAVAAVNAMPDPVARFLACDAALSERMVADATTTGATVIARSADTPLAVTAGLAASALGFR